MQSPTTSTTYNIPAATHSGAYLYCYLNMLLPLLLFKQAPTSAAT